MTRAQPAGELHWAEGVLARAGVPSPRVDAELLLAFAVGAPRSGLGAISCLDEAVVGRFRDAVARRATREPLQHITEVAHFRHLNLRVGPGVFTPRPETEVLAGEAIAELRRLVGSGVRSPLAVDLCTGSGAVALAMATEVPSVRVVAVELSEAALRYAVVNATGTNVDLRLGDIATAVDDLAGLANVVTANPPYIPLSAYESVECEARNFDPALALWSGEDGLDMVRSVAHVAARLLRHGGLVACEHADVQGQLAPAVFTQSGAWSHVRGHRDLAGRPRFLTARRASAHQGRAGTMAS